MHTRVARLSRHRLLTVEEVATVKRHLREFRDVGGTLVAIRRGSPQWQELGRAVHAEIEASMPPGEARMRMLEATTSFVDESGRASRIWGEREFLRGELMVARNVTGRVAGVALVGPGLGYWGVNSVGSARGTDLQVKGSGTALLAAAASLAAGDGEILVGHPQQPGWSHAIGRRRLYDPRTTDQEGWSRAAVREVASCFVASGLSLERSLKHRAGARPRTVI